MSAVTASVITRYVFVFECLAACFDISAPCVSLLFSSREGVVFVVSSGICSIEIPTCRGLVFSCFYPKSFYDEAYVRLSRAQCTRHTTICFDPKTKLFYTVLTPDLKVIRCLKSPEQSAAGLSSASDVLVYFNYLNIPKKSIEYSPRRQTNRACLLYNFRRFVAKYQHLLLVTTAVTHTDYIRPSLLYAVGARAKRKHNFKPVDEDVWDRLPLKRFKTKPSPVPTQITRLSKFLQDLLNLLGSVIQLNTEPTEPCQLCFCNRASSYQPAKLTTWSLTAACFINYIISLSKHVLAAANISSRTCGSRWPAHYKKLVPSPLVHIRASHTLSTLLESRKVLLPLDFESIASSITWRRYIYRARRRGPSGLKPPKPNTQLSTVFFLFSKFFTLVCSFSHFIRVSVFRSQAFSNKKIAAPQFKNVFEIKQGPVPVIYDSSDPRRKLFLMRAVYSAIVKFAKNNKRAVNTELSSRVSRKLFFRHHFPHPMRLSPIARYPHTRFKRCFLFYKKKKKLVGPFFKKMLVL